MSLHDPNLQFAIWKEQHEDRLRAAQRERLLEIARRSPHDWRLHPFWMLAGWLIRVGRRLCTRTNG